MRATETTGQRGLWQAWPVQGVNRSWSVPSWVRLEGYRNLSCPTVSVARTAKGKEMPSYQRRLISSNERPISHRIPSRIMEVISRRWYQSPSLVQQRQQPAEFALNHLGRAQQVIMLPRTRSRCGCRTRSGTDPDCPEPARPPRSAACRGRTPLGPATETSRHSSRCRVPEGGPDVVVEPNDEQIEVAWCPRDRRDLLLVAVEHRLARQRKPVAIPPPPGRSKMWTRRGCRTQ